jgi:hypothetical protein
LDLGGQRERGAALAPFEQVGVAAVSNDHVGECVREDGDRGDHLAVGIPRERDLEHADGVAAVGDRHRQLRTFHELAHVDLLGAQHVFVHRARQRHGLGLLAALHPRAGIATHRRAEADQGRGR